LFYGPKVEIEVPDLSLFHLDMLLSDYPGASFQLHVVLSAAGDGNLLSLSIGSGVPLALDYCNGPELRIDAEVLEGLSTALRERGLVSLPMLPSTP